MSVDITAPLYWWKEFDTYKVGTTANSTSTMHKIMSQPITFDSFEIDDFANININGRWFTRDIFRKVISYCEDLRQEYLRIQKELESTSNDNRNELEYNAYLVWKELIRLIPESWLQTRTVTMNYENLLAMCSKSQRRPHKLNEWSGKRNPDLENFIKWARTLPYAQEFIFFDELETPQDSFNDAKDKMFIAIDKLLDSNAAQEFKIDFNKLTHTFGYQGVM